MNENEIYKTLITSGAYSLPYLLRFEGKGDDGATAYLVNNNEDVVFENQRYLASSFSYTPGKDGAGTLEIDIYARRETNGLIDETLNQERISCDIVGVLVKDEQGEKIVQRLKTYSHKWGTASWENGKMTFTFEGDDRFSMTFPALVFDSNCNRGNT